MAFDKNILHDRKIAILATDGVDESQLLYPKQALEDAGAKVSVISIKHGEIKAWDQDHWGRSFQVDATLSECSSEDFDSLLIPGGEKNPESLFLDKKAMEFVKDFAYEGKSIASICHGTKMLLDSGVARGKIVTTWPELKNDVLSSGAKWKDDEVVAHKGIISSRSTKQDPLFIKRMIEDFSISPRSKKIS